jgi:hypothetical protein
MRQTSATTICRLTLRMMVGIITLLTPLSASSGQAQPSDPSKRGPGVVLPFRVNLDLNSRTEWMDISRYTSEQLTRRLREAKLPVYDQPRVTGLASDDLNALRSQKDVANFAQKAGVCYILRGDITSPQVEVKDEGLWKLIRTKVPMQVEIVHGLTGETVRAFSVEGLSSKKDRDLLGGISERQRRSQRAQQLQLNEVKEAVNNGINELTKKIIEGYPSELWEPVDPRKRPARMTVRVTAGSPSEAIRKGIESVCSQIVPKDMTTERHTELISSLAANKDTLDAEVKLLTDGVYTVSYAITDIEEKRQTIFARLAGADAIRMPTVAVLSPEPAAQSFLQEYLRKSGFIVKDDQRMMRMRERQYVEAMLEGKTDPLELQALRENLGVDIVIPINTICERLPVKTTKGDILIRASLSLKAILPDTYDVITSLQDKDTDGDITERIAHEQAVKSVAAMVAPQLVENLFARLQSFGDQTRIYRVEITGWSNRTDADTFIDALEKLNGVIQVEEQRFEGGILTVSVKIDQAVARRLAREIETHQSMSRFRIRIETTSRSLIKGKRDPEETIVKPFHSASVADKPKVSPSSEQHPSHTGLRITSVLTT